MRQWIHQVNGRCTSISNYRGYKPESEIFLVVDPVDFRKSVDGLTAIIQLELQRNPLASGCYVFCNKAHDKIKLIEWDFNGFWLSYKRLESGKFKWPKSTMSVTSISRQQYDWLMNGLDIYQRDGFSEVLARKVI